MASLSSYRSVIKSIQSLQSNIPDGSSAISNTINPVVVAKTTVTVSTRPDYGCNTFPLAGCAAYLTSTTNVECKRTIGGGAAAGVFYSIEVIEYY